MSKGVIQDPLGLASSSGSGTVGGSPRIYRNVIGGNKPQQFTSPSHNLHHRDYIHHVRSSLTGGGGSSSSIPVFETDGTRDATINSVGLNQIELDTLTERNSATNSKASTSGHSSIRSGSTVVDNSSSNIIPESKDKLTSSSGFDSSSPRLKSSSSPSASPARDVSKSGSPFRDKRQLNKIHLDDDEDEDFGNDHFDHKDDAKEEDGTKTVQFITSL